MVQYKFCPQCQRPMEHDAEGHPYCPHCQITIYRNVAVCANVLPIKDNQVLLAVRALDPYKGTIDTVGGFAKAGETIQQCALREAKEETGLDMHLIDLLGNYPDRYGDEDTDLLSFAFIAEISGGGQPKPADDVAELKWFPIAKPPLDQIGFASAKQIVKDLNAWHKKS